MRTGFKVLVLSSLMLSALPSAQAGLFGKKKKSCGNAAVGVVCEAPASPCDGTPCGDAGPSYGTAQSDGSPDCAPAMPAPAPAPVYEERKITTYKSVPKTREVEVTVYKTMPTEEKYTYTEIGPQDHQA